MANTESAKKAIRSSARKKTHNLFWEKKIKETVKSIKNSLGSKKDGPKLVKELTLLQKILDKAAKEKVIHKNKANRIKSMYARRISSLLQRETAPRRGSAKAK